MAACNARFDEKWAIIESTFNRVASCTISEYSFQTLYDTVYQLVRQHNGELLLERLTGMITKRVEASVKGVVTAPLESILEALRDSWRFHTLTVSKTSDFLFFFNKQYCQPRSKPTVTELGVRIFGEHLLRNVELRDRIRDAFLLSTSRERAGDTTETPVLLGEISQILLTVNGFWMVQEPYLKQVYEFHAELAGSHASSSVTEFVHVYERYLAQEKTMAQHCLGDRIVPRVETLMQELWLIRHKDKMLTWEQLSPLLLDRSEVALRAVFLAFQSIGELDGFLAVVKQFIVKEGCAVAGNVPSSCVEKLISLEKYTRHLMTHTFHSETSAKEVGTLIRAFQDVLDKNAIVAERMASYLDTKLRQCSDSDFDAAMDDVISLFKLLRDKDLFEAEYKQQLAHRLLAPALPQCEEERERLFVAKFKREVGCSSTSRIEGMFSDRKISDETSQRFVDHLAQRNTHLPIEFSVSTLTSGYWPPFRNATMAVPDDLQRCMEAFQSFYLERHNGRRLEFCLSQGSCDVRVYTGGKRYEVQLPVAYTPVLLLFQSDGRLSASEVADRTQQVLGEAIKALMALARPNQSQSGILVAATSGDGAKGGFNAATEFSFNGELRARSLKFKIAEIAVKEKSSGSSSLEGAPRGRMDEDRKFKIDAALVRVMKSRRSLDHQSLVTEVQRVMRQSFEASHEEVKRRIEHLLEREFIGRSPELPGCYTYIA